MNILLESPHKFYKFFCSPLLHQAAFGGCRFYPTCSDYGLEAIRQYGLILGFVLLLKRIGKCHPWHDGGYDPVLPGPCRSGSGADQPRGSTQKMDF